MANKVFILVCALLIHISWIHAFEGLSRPRALTLRGKHIIGGDYAEMEDTPYQLSMQTYLLHTCGAVIVSADYALTAAHCNFMRGIFKNFVTLTAGSKTLFWGGQWHYLEKTFSHPQYSSRDADYDIAVLKVRNPFPVTNKIKPVPLPTQSENDFLDFNKLATVSGFGDAEGVLMAIWLRKANVPLVTREKCQQLYSVEKEYPYQITPRMICAGGLKRGDTCQGDSGGPMVHKGHLIGLTSWGIGCDDRRYPGVYTNLFDPEIRQFIATSTDKVIL